MTFLCVVKMLIGADASQRLLAFTDVPAFVNDVRAFALFAMTELIPWPLHARNAIRLDRHSKLWFRPSY